MKKQLGFTLMELMITLLLSAVLMMIAAPSFKNFLKSNSVQSDSRLLRADLAYARSEAVSRNAFVTICASSNGASCSGSANWSDGWIIFVDNGAGGAASDMANISQSNNEPVVRVNQKQNNNVILAADTAGAGVRGVMFDTRGYMAGLKRSTTVTTVDKVSLVICEPDGVASFARAVFIEVTGRALDSVDSNSDGVHDNIAGDDLSCAS